LVVNSDVEAIERRNGERVKWKMGRNEKK
jgi:hypothetical protein